MASEDLIKAEVAAMAKARKLELAKSVATRITQLEDSVARAFDDIEKARALITKAYALDLDDKKAVNEFISINAQSGTQIYLRTN